MFQIPCVIFAGGKSSRMKEDKSLLPFAGFNTLTQYQYSRLSKIFNNVYISCKDKNKFDFDANFIEDTKDKTFAPTSGFLAIYEQLQRDFFAISVDTPFLNNTEIEKIIDHDRADADATIAKTNFGIHPICGIYHYSLKDKFILMDRENNHKLGFLLKNSNTIFVDFNDEKPFLNLNHPHEYQEALTLI